MKNILTNNSIFKKIIHDKHFSQKKIHKKKFCEKKYSRKKTLKKIHCSKSLKTTNLMKKMIVDMEGYLHVYI